MTRVDGDADPGFQPRAQSAEDRLHVHGHGSHELHRALALLFLFACGGSIFATRQELEDRAHLLVAWMPRHAWLVRGRNL